jgi:hypothetical protein
MKADLSRDTFDANKHFLRVLQQQGRVHVDADWNEQVSILLHHLRSLALESIGNHGASNDGFQILARFPAAVTLKNDFAIRAGRYYVQGVLCENPSDVLLSGLPKVAHPHEKPADGGTYLVYLEAWERHISYIEDDSIREKALNGADTADRSQLVWQIRLNKLENNMPAPRAVMEYKIDANAYNNFLNRIENTTAISRFQLKADLNKNGQLPTEPCMVRPESRYYGLENQLYRVEIHKPGPPGVATWKWSRDNGSVTFPMANEIATEGDLTTITLESFGRSSEVGLKVNDLVEVVDDEYARTFDAGKLLKVKELREDEGQVILDGTPDGNVGKKMDLHPFLRRWDHTPTPINLADNTINLEEDKPIQLEKGIQVTFGFDPAESNPPAPPTRWYENGAYWLIPARVATGDIEWETDLLGKRKWLPPKGVRHYYAPLAHLNVANDGVVTATDLRHQLGTKEVMITLTPNLVPTGGPAWSYLPQGYASKDGAETIAHGMMPISLPHGAKIRSFRFMGVNTGAGQFIVALNRQLLPVTLQTKDDIEPIISASGVNGANFGLADSFDPNDSKLLVDNANFRYFLNADLTNAATADNVTLHAIQIGVTAPS